MVLPEKNLMLVSPTWDTQWLTMASQTAIDGSVQTYVGISCPCLILTWRHMSNHQNAKTDKIWCTIITQNPTDNADATRKTDLEATRNTWCGLNAKHMIWTQRKTQDLGSTQNKIFGLNAQRQDLDSTHRDKIWTQRTRQDMDSTLKTRFRLHARDEILTQRTRQHLASTHKTAFGLNTFEKNVTSRLYKKRHLKTKSK